MHMLSNLLGQYAIQCIQLILMVMLMLMLVLMLTLMLMLMLMLMLKVMLPAKYAISCASRARKSTLVFLQ